jgi:hypothetical protein
MKGHIKNIFHNNYAMAVISIILIVLIVAISLNFNPQASSSDSSGQAYLQNIDGKIIRVEKSPAMIKTYVETEPQLAYLRDK